MLAVLHLTTRTPEIYGAILVNGKAVQLTDLELRPVVGTIVNGKGEKTQLDTHGIALTNICEGDTTVTSSDEYSAVIAADELSKAYLISEGDSLRLVVFGDENAKRDVKNVVRIDFR